MSAAPAEIPGGSVAEFAIARIKARRMTVGVRQIGIGCATLALTLAFPAVMVTRAAEEAPKQVAADDYHPWARFEPGSWKQVRVITETLDANGRVESASTTETKTTLVGIDESSFTLKVEVTVEFAGKRFPAEPTYVKQGFLGESVGQSVEMKPLGPGAVTICGRSYPTQIRQFVIAADDIARDSTVHYSENVAPFVLRRETKTSSSRGNAEATDSLVEVIAVEMPYKVLSQVKQAAFVKTVQTQAKKLTSETIEVHCIDVPGAVVTHSAKEYDGTGRVARRSTLELMDYEIARPDQRPAQAPAKRRLFYHLRTRRP